MTINRTGRIGIGRAAATISVLALSLTPIAGKADPLPSWNDQIELLKGLGDELATATDNANSDAARQEMVKPIC